MVASDEQEAVHELAPFLQERLPALGLDYDTYGAYVLPLLTSGEEVADEDEWESVMELLQASSESHTDDDEAWVQLRSDIERVWKEYRDRKSLQEASAALDERMQLQKQIEEERKRISEAASKSPPTAKKPDDAAKRALLDRFGYEDPDEDGKAASGDAEEPVSNREVAKLMDLAKARAMREHKGATKREEQQKTALARKNKMDLKEERRKRATKGERKR